jgi:hypothetical protein
MLSTWTIYCANVGVWEDMMQRAVSVIWSNPQLLADILERLQNDEVVDR